ncbi:SLAP domain-containing protein [Lactobacillus sp. ESL0681]|uniref:SLAP domain-containing protein n=1 Tax=Lactobacillus sp. ESL0681 TaxID=2983211 RepID=UPI0023F68409|nr:SLAP domain-containing protein [Lactobacillus sp. ESL0681]WEV39957.1 SLAP domain-containing protein [Lactobacillus sp. ESL0681]
MKKNLRIVSATAAALLAVAPVAASTVSSVFAADSTTQAPSTPTNAPADSGIPVTNGTVGQNAKAQEVNVSVNVTNASSLKDGDAAASVQASLNTELGTGVTGVTASVAGVVNPTTNTVDKAYVYESDANGKVAADAKPVRVLAAGKTYVAVAQRVTLSGLNATTKYIFNGQKGDAEGKPSATGTDGVYGQYVAPQNVASAPFTVPDATKQGNPYFYGVNEKKAVSVGAVSLKTDKTVINTVSDLSTAIKSAYDARIDASGDNAATVNYKSVDDAVKDALKKANVTVDSKGKFAAPANDFTVTVTAVASNGKTATLPVLVRTVAATTTSYPQIGLVGDTDASLVSAANTNGQVYKSGNETVEVTSSDFDFNATTGKGFNYLPVNTPVTDAIVKNIKDAFVTKINGNTGVSIDTTVDTSKVNTKVAGKYPVVVSATNPAGLTTKVTFMLTVGAKDAKYATVQYEKGLSIPVYTINGNNVTAENGVTIADGTQVAYYGAPVTVGGKSYTRINKKDGNEFIETQYIDGSYKPQAQSTKTVMHASFVYDKNHKRVDSKRIATYKDVTVYGEKTKLNDGTEAYMIGTNEYIDADNVDGHNVTLNHNSYVYKTSKKRANKNKLMKGETVLVYGSPVTLKSGQKFYRIGNKKFIKAVNADDPKNAK